jgi:hypothetical protein
MNRLDQLDQLDNRCNAARNNNTNLRCPHKKIQNTDFCCLHADYKKKFISNIHVANQNNQIDHDLSGNKNSGENSNDNTESELNEIVKSTVELNLESNNIMEKIAMQQDMLSKCMNIKITIIINNYEDQNKLKALIGPIFNDITLSEDEMDPISLTPFWTLSENGTRIPTNINKYFLFSYFDSQNKIRCFYIYTIHDLIKQNMLYHPVTQEPFDKKTLDRASELINIYFNELGINMSHDINKTLKEKLIAKTTEVFQKINKEGIIIDEAWFINLSKQDVSKFHKELKTLVEQNIPNKKLHVFKTINEKEGNKKIGPMNLKMKIIKNIDQFLELSKENNMFNICALILITALTIVSPGAKEKYPDIQLVN